MTRLMLATLAGAAVVASAGVASAQTYGPSYRYGAPYAYDSPDYSYSTPWNSAAPRGGTYKMRAFKSQEVWPQSPPSGGY
jgi:hypothetical protein